MTRRARPLLILIAGCSLGCGAGSPPAAPPAETVPAVPTVPTARAAPKESEAVRDFRAKVTTYLAEARAGAKLLTLAPSPAQAKAKADQITELYTHLPDVPPEVDGTGAVAARLKNINGSFAVAAFHVGLRVKAERLGSPEGVEGNTASLNAIAADVRRFAAEIESKLAAR